jgi:hypothetical protein
MKNFLTILAALALITLISANLPGDTGKSMANVKNTNGVFWFYECEPTNNYNTVIENNIVVINTSILSNMAKVQILDEIIENNSVDAIIINIVDGGYNIKGIQFK